MIPNPFDRGITDRITVIQDKHDALAEKHQALKEEHDALSCLVADLTIAVVTTQASLEVFANGEKWTFAHFTRVVSERQALVDAAILARAEAYRKAGKPVPE